MDSSRTSRGGKGNLHAIEEGGGFIRDTTRCFQEASQRFLSPTGRRRHDAETVKAHDGFRQNGPALVAPTLTVGYGLVTEHQHVRA